MGYIKKDGCVIAIDTICVVLLQICIVADALIGFDPKLYIVSKGVILLFIVSTIINLLYRREVWIGRSSFSQLLFIFITGFSFIWSVYPDITLKHIKTQIQLYILFLAVYFFLLTNKISIKKYTDAIYYAGVGMVVFALYRYGFTGIINGLNNGARIGGEITNENVFGIIFARATLVAFYYFIKSSNKINLRSLYLSSILIFTLFAFSSGSRKAVLMIFVGIVSIVLLENGVRNIWKSFLISAIMVTLLLFLLRLPLFTTANNRITELIIGKKDSSELVREHMIELSMELFKEKPLLGHGLKTFGAITKMGTYSHNNFTEILVSVGITGFILFYIPYIEMVKCWWERGAKQKNYLVTLFFLLSIINFVFGYAMVEFYDKEYWIFAGVMIACLDSNSNNLKSRF